MRNHQNGGKLFLFNACRLCSKPAADLESSAPVGSSAKINLGFPIIALAATVRCCCPPKFDTDIYL